MALEPRLTVSGAFWNVTTVLAATGVGDAIGATVAAPLLDGLALAWVVSGVAALVDGLAAAWFVLGAAAGEVESPQAMPTNRTAATKTAFTTTCAFCTQRDRDNEKGRRCGALLYSI